MSYNPVTKRGILFGDISPTCEVDGCARPAVGFALQMSAAITSLIVPAVELEGGVTFLCQKHRAMYEARQATPGALPRHDLGRMGGTMNDSDLSAEIEAKLADAMTALARFEEALRVFQASARRFIDHNAVAARKAERP